MSTKDHPLPGALMFHPYYPGYACQGHANVKDLNDGTCVIYSRHESRGTADEHTPEHYRGKDGLQPFDVIDAFQLDFYEGNAVKYLLRWRQKNGVEDLRKARHLVDQIIDRAVCQGCGADNCTTVHEL